MKRIIFFCVSFLLIFSACKKGSDEVPFSGDFKFPNCKLMELHKVGDFKSYSYEYDALGRLIKETRKWSGVPREWVVLHYENNRLASREHWTHYPSATEKLVQFDTLIYNDLGQVIEKRQLPEPGSPAPSHSYFYEYNSSGNPVKSRLFYFPGNEFWFSHKYFWTNGNITKIEDYVGDFQQLQHEWFYDYGQALNYQKLLGLFPEHPEYQTINMIYSMKAKDYTGLLDLICNPCFHTFKLNEQGLPKIIRYDWDENDTVLTWDCD